MMRTAVIGALMSIALCLGLELGGMLTRYEGRLDALELNSDLINAKVDYGATCSLYNQLVSGDRGEVWWNVDRSEVVCVIFSGHPERVLRLGKPQLDKFKEELKLKEKRGNL